MSMIEKLQEEVKESEAVEKFLMDIIKNNGDKDEAIKAHFREGNVVKGVWVNYKEEEEEDEEEFDYCNYNQDKNRDVIDVAGGGMGNGNAYATIEKKDGLYYYCEYGKYPVRQCVGTKIIYDERPDGYKWNFNVE